MRIKHLVIQRKLSKMKNKILPTCLQGNYGDSLEKSAMRGRVWGWEG